MADEHTAPLESTPTDESPIELSAVATEGEEAISSAVEEDKPEPAKEEEGRQSLDVEGSDLEEEMNQMETGHAALLDPPLTEDEAQTTPTLESASASNPFLTRKAAPPDILTTSPSGQPLLDEPTASTSSLHPPDSPTHEMIETLRKQLEQVTDQRDMLNSKLVMSFSRVADLEDDLDHIKQTETEQRSRIDILEYEKKEHLHALDTGLLVERSNVKVELQRLASTLVEEQSKRGVAEEGRRTVENEVDDLAASLFQQANSMVATERLARSRAETRLASTEENLQVAEGVVRELQVAMQTLSHAQPSSPRPASRQLGPASSQARPLLQDHIPYTEFLLFLRHLRNLRPQSHNTTIPPPTLVSLLSHPFIARLVAEDHDPALRLDFAPGVTFFSKKSISQAVIDGMLIIEPVQAHKVFLQKPDGEILCSLSGKQIVPASANQLVISHTSPSSSTFPSSTEISQSRSQPSPPPSSSSRNTLASASRFFGRSSSRPPSPTPSSAVLPPVPSPSPALSITSSHPPIYIFRIAPPPSAQPSSNPPHLYPIEAGWSLERLRAACELWRFVKMGIIAPVWAYEDGTEGAGAEGSTNGLGLTPGERPPLPARKSSKGWVLGGLGFKSGSGSGWNLGIGGGGGGTGSAPSSPKDEATTPTAVKEPPKLPPRRMPPPPTPSRVEAKVEEVKESAVEPVVAPEIVVVEEDRVAEEVEAPLVAPVVPLESSEEVAAPTQPEVAPEANAIPIDPSTSEHPLSAVDETPAAVTTTDDAPSNAPLTETTSLEPTTPKSSSSEGFSTPTGEAAHLAPEQPLGEDGNPLSPSETTEETPESVLDAREPVVDAPKEEEVSTTEPNASSDITTKPEESHEPPAVDTPLPSSIDTTAPVRASLDEARPSTPSSATPPPLPKRAAARRAVPAPPGGKTSSISSLSEVAIPALVPVVVEPATKEKEVVETEKENGDGKQEETKASTSVVEVPKPALPPRREKVESWEEKTWRELVKVKEDLFWKRVGVKQEE